VRLQEQLVERERLAAIGTTAATFAHEIGNPLNSMFMMGQLLERYLAKNHDRLDQKAGETLHNLMSEMKRLSTLLSEFRSLARRQKLDLRPVSLTAIIADVLAVETPSYHASGVCVEQDAPVDLPVIVVDAEKVRQAVLNLCKNAVEAMPQGGTLRVSAKHEEGTIRVAISDTGAGIPSGVNIFAPFITTKSQGTGLGLTIVRQIVAAHHGTLTYHSMPGHGTTFTLEFPVTPPPGYESRDTTRRAPTSTRETTEHSTHRE
jgi:signal transduction histidine kinase